MFKVLTNQMQNYWLYMVTDLNAEALYVGAEKLPDIFTFRKLTTMPEFRKCEGITVTLIDNYKTLMDATNARGLFIRNKLQGITPPLNLAAARLKSREIVCNQTGHIYGSQSEACRMLGLHASSLSNHLAGKPGFKTIKGMTFDYVGNKPQAVPIAQVKPSEPAGFKRLREKDQLWFKVLAKMGESVMDDDQLKEWQRLNNQLEGAEAFELQMLDLERTPEQEKRLDYLRSKQGW